VTGMDAAALAQRLAAAAADRRAVPMLSASTPGLDVASAYAVQRAGLDARLAAGERVVGYKLGLVSRAKQEAMGVTEPLWGWLTDAMVLAEEDPLDLAALIHPRVEPELAFLLGRDLDPSAATVPQVLAATEAVFPALEVLDSRYEEFRFTLPDVIADNASAARIVLGGRALAPGRLDLQLEGMALSRDGEVVDTAAGAAVAGHPAAAVGWLARAAGGLTAGSLILSGGLTAPVELDPGSVVTARFATLGSVTLRCAS
jgi:2-oxo-3-hexenedioate decarboxylase